VEERIAHAAALQACSHFGVHSYQSFVDHYGLGPVDVDPEQAPGLSMIVAELIDVLEEPSRVTAWSEHGECDFGIETLRSSWLDQTQNP
jgi:hypothetical protein